MAQQGVHQNCAQGSLIMGRIPDRVHNTPMSGDTETKGWKEMIRQVDLTSGDFL